MARLGVVPFEAALGFLVFFAGVVNLLHLSTSTDALNGLLPSALTTALNVSYTLSGLLMLLGLGSGRRDLEGAGIVALGTGMGVRATAIVVVVGITLQTSALLILYGVFMSACVVRLRSLARNELVIKIGNHQLVGADRTDILEEELQMRDDRNDEEE